MNTCEQLKKQIEDTRARMDEMIEESGNILAGYEVSIKLDDLISEYEYLKQKEMVH